MATNESVFAMAGYSVFRHAGTEVDFYFIDEDNICRLLNNVEPELKLNKSPTIAKLLCNMPPLVS